MVKQQVILQHRDNISNRQIARNLGINRETVNKYVQEYEKKLEELLTANPEMDPEEIPPDIIEKPKYDVSNRGPRKKTEDATKVIKECLEENRRKRETGRSKQQMKITDIRRYLKDNGYSISYSTVKRIVRKLEDTTHEAFIKQEYDPGRVCEFDWGEVTLDIGGTGFKRYQMAVFTSAYCNYRFAKLYRHQDTAAFQEAHVDFFRFCRGVYHTMTYDNMRVAVKTFVGPSEKEPTDALLQLSAYYGFHFRFCNIRSGNEKGHVERSVDVVRRYAFSEPGSDQFESLEAANSHLLEKCVRENSEPLSDDRIPQECFIEEKNVLMVMPPPMPCFVHRRNCKVNKYSTICVNNSHYSVPDKYTGKRVDVRIFTDKIQVLYEGKAVASHERSIRTGSWSIDINHYLRTFRKKPGAIAHSTALRQADTQLKEIYDKYFTTNPKGFIDLLDLIETYGTEKILEALKKVSNMTVHDINAQKVEVICKTADKNCISEPKKDRLSEKSKATLIQYDTLRQLQKEASRKAVL